ncbi:MAG TPA: hypothetical protein VGS08_06150 [Candidatus Saccharimonadales bacterium]|nr:hypothetical protein [Candidatus Saccharimonadales bacterium]
MGLPSARREAGTFLFCPLQSFAEAGFPPGVQHGLKRFIQFATGDERALLVGLDEQFVEDGLVEDLPGAPVGGLV